MKDWEPKSKEFAAAHKKSDKKIEDGEEAGHDVTFKAGTVTKANSGKRPVDNTTGDKNVVKSTEVPTKKLKEGGKLLDIQILDHIIVTKNSYTSLADECLM